MTDPNFASVNVSFLSSEAIGGYPDPGMQWSIRREIVRHNIVDRARFVQVVCGGHEGGHPKDEYADSCYTAHSYRWMPTKNSSPNSTHIQIP